MANQFEVRVDSLMALGNVLVTEDGEFYAVDGIAVEPVRLPKDEHALDQIVAVINAIADRNYGVDDDGPRIY